MGRGFEVAKGWEDKNINLPVRKTARSAGYDVEAAEDIIIPGTRRWEEESWPRVPAGWKKQ